MNKSNIFFELLKFLIQQKKYWVIPILTVLILLGLLIIFSEGSVLSPFVYTLF